MKKFIVIFSLLLTTICFAEEEFKTYSGTVTDCYDADTCTVTFHIQQDVQVGFGVVVTVTTQIVDQKVRLYGIDAWEMRGEEKPKGIVARDWMREQVVNKVVRIDVLQKSGKDAKGKYGRWLVKLYRGITDLNAELVKLGHAEEATY